MRFDHISSTDVAHIAETLGTHHSIGRLARRHGALYVAEVFRRIKLQRDRGLQRHPSVRSCKWRALLRHGRRCVASAILRKSANDPKWHMESIAESKATGVERALKWLKLHGPAKVLVREYQLPFCGWQAFAVSSRGKTRILVAVKPKRSRFKLRTLYNKKKFLVAFNEEESHRFTVLKKNRSSQRIG